MNKKTYLGIGIVALALISSLGFSGYPKAGVQIQPPSTLPKPIEGNNQSTESQSAPKPEANASYPGSPQPGAQPQPSMHI